MSKNDQPQLGCTIVICRVDSEGRDVTDIPELWSEDNICVTKADVEHIQRQILLYCLRMTKGQCLGVSK